MDLDLNTTMANGEVRTDASLVQSVRFSVFSMDQEKLLLLHERLRQVCRKATDVDLGERHVGRLVLSKECYDQEGDTCKEEDDI